MGVRSLGEGTTELQNFLKFHDNTVRFLRSTFPVVYIVYTIT